MSIPFRATGATITASGSTTSTTEQSLGLTQPRHTLRIYNSTAAVAFCKFGATGITAATSADYPVPPGYVDPITVTGDMSHVRVLLSTGTGSVFFTPGEAGTI